MPPSTRRRPWHRMAPPPAEFSGSDEDVDDEEMDPEEEDGDAMGDEMVAMEGEEDLEEEDGLGKSFLVACPDFVLCHVTKPSHVRPLDLELPRGLYLRIVCVTQLRSAHMCFVHVVQADFQKPNMWSLCQNYFVLTAMDLHL